MFLQTMHGMNAQGAADMLQKMVAGHEPRLFEKPLAMSASCVTQDVRKNMHLQASAATGSSLRAP